MSYIDKHLLPNEKVFYKTNLHWVIFILPIAFTIVMILFLIHDIGIPIINYGGLIITAWFWLSAYVKFITAEFAVTNMRVLMKIGLFQVKTLDTLLQRIGGIQVQQSIIGRILGYGSITVIGTAGTQDIFPLITDPIIYRLKIQEQIQQAIGSGEK